MDKITKMIFCAALMIFTFCPAVGAQVGGGMDENMIEELRKLIEQQQKQLDRQGAEIAKLKEQLGGAVQQVEPKVDKAELEELDIDKVVTSRFKHVDVNLYGHLNKGILWSENRDSSKIFFVDNSNSQSRIGINASVVSSDGLTVGGKIEYGIKSNATTDVSQIDTNDATSVNWNLRHADIFFNSKTFGKISIGYGSTASDGTAEIDLSGTSVVSYSDMSAIAGGQYFYDSDNDNLTDTRVEDVFTNMDGLGRDDRLRIDTPSYNGLTLSSSAVSGDAYDAAIRYSRIYGETKVAAAVAWAKPADIQPSVKYRYDGSMSLLFGNGLNATLAGGLWDMRYDGRDDGTFWYTKLGYRLEVCSLGKTSFSVDYGENMDIELDGDEAKSWSVAAVQDISSWGTEFYLAYRNYRLDRIESSLDDVNAVLGGARVKF